jgi:hypothetical protein
MNTTTTADPISSAHAGRTDVVRFRLRDACVPPANELLAALWGDHVLEGQIVGRSRTSADGDFVVVKVRGMEQLVVVSIGLLLAGR